MTDLQRGFAALGRGEPDALVALLQPVLWFMFGVGLALLLSPLFNGCVSLDQMEEDYIQRYPGMSTKTQQAIRGGWVYVGMPAKHVGMAIGRPDRVNKTTTENSVRKQLVYQLDAYNAAYVYVEGGEVTAIQEDGYKVTP
jgi:hypothetical protein